MSRATFKTPDFRKAITNLEKVRNDKLKEISQEIEDTADQIVELAKAAAPVNESLLRNSISKKQEEAFVYSIVAPTKYAGFMEFGTRKLVNIPPGAEEIAKEVQKVKGGNIKEMEASIRRWVRLKGIVGTFSVKTRRRTKFSKAEQEREDSAVFLIMRKILKVGVKPHPFFFPAIQKATPGLSKKLIAILKR